tara:strand:- start:452 stop:703 length:252 start_codon:yes stop_codon:yes gene_type:complete
MLYKRGEFRACLDRQSIAIEIHYPKALSFLKVYEYQVHRPNDFLLAYDYHSNIFFLPMYPEMTKEMVYHVYDAIERFYQGILR